MKISRQNCYIIFGLCLVFVTIAWCGCASKPAYYTAYRPFYQDLNEEIHAKPPQAQPITPQLARTWPHLQAYVGYLFIGNQHTQWVLTGVPTLPNRMDAQPLFRTGFTKEHGQWREISELADISLVVRYQDEFLHPTGIQFNQKDNLATLNLIYGHSHSWQQTPLQVSFSLATGSNQLMAHWQQLTPEATADSGVRPGPDTTGELTLKIDGKPFQSIRLSPPTSANTGSLLTFLYGSAPFAISLTEPWKMIEDAASSRLKYSLQSDPTLARAQFTLGRAGLMELPVAASRLLQCPDNASPATAPCEPEPEETKLTLRSWRLQVAASAQLPQPAVSRQAYVDVQPPGFQTALQLPVRYGDELTFQVPAASTLHWQGQGQSPTLETGDERRFHLPDSRTFGQLKLASAMPHSTISGLPLSVRLQAKHDADQGITPILQRRGDTTEFGRFQIFDSKALAAGLNLATGNYEVILAHPLGPLCRQTLAVHANQPTILTCPAASNWQQTLARLKQAQQEYQPHFAPSERQDPPPEPTLSESASADEPPPGTSSWRIDGASFEFPITVRLPTERAETLQNQWTELKPGDRPQSVFQLNRWLADHHPEATLSVGCPYQRLPVHDYLNLARTLSPQGLAAFGCHDPAYEAELLAVADQLLTTRETPFWLQLSGESTPSPNRLAYPARFHVQGHAPFAPWTLGAGAILRFVPPSETIPVTTKDSNQPEHRLRVTLEALAFSPLYDRLHLRIYAIQASSEERRLVKDESLHPANHGTMTWTLTLPEHTRYLRAELISRDLSPDRPTTLATSQYFSIDLSPNQKEARSP
jgi:hypothetical protein